MLPLLRGGILLKGVFNCYHPSRNFGKVRIDLGAMWLQKAKQILKGGVSVVTKDGLIFSKLILENVL